MNPHFLYAIAGVGLISLGLFALLSHAHLLRKIMAVNILGTGIFMTFIALAGRTPSGVPDPVPQAMVLTGIVVAVSATGFALALVIRLRSVTGRTTLPEDSGEGKS